MNDSARRVNHLARALGFRTYLEIGVSLGTTFFDVDIETKLAVDPHFRFDAAARRGPSESYFEETSDAFFLRQPPERSFDLIYIDGLHRFEQVVRDFSNAIAHSTPRSVIILDDTKPCDVFSAVPDMQKAVRFRKASGVDNGFWHGDVFKTVFYIHDFWPALNYRTIVGKGNPQTLVWRSTRGGRKPKYNDLERISRLTYYDLMDNLDVLREASEAASLALCIQEVGGA